jgi:hypothetical protein
MTFKAEIRASIGWNWNQGAADNQRLDSTRQLLEGNGAGQAEAVWHDEDVPLQDGVSETIDLTRLQRDALGATLTTTLLGVKAMLVLSDRTSVGRLVLGGAGPDEWSAPFGADGDSLEVPPDGVVLLANRGDGWPVDDAAKLLKLSAVGGPVMYSIALVGTLTSSGSASGGSGSGSSGSSGA